ncbi:hypothetical protein IT97_00235 [Listeria monocytogenes]|uniref:hypothetical protein n=1 Tax=Listeria monocytogenes TaxID=1639 RepID=UPI00087370BC|nr:hypothetical protein [Listeria monocytogenes]EAC8432164.1 hypothetical protein [Listeria monocytogenes]EAG3549143.1 hypothetical protein [Listeria monocytogenes]EKZ0807693.1 hypothetical protein [Listeria monocytogenes]OFF92119.1 hypothetical protein BJM52_05430 [Listeria monocytogenes]
MECKHCKSNKGYYEIREDGEFQVMINSYQTKQSGTRVTVHNKDFAICPTTNFGVPCIAVINIESQELVFTSYFSWGTFENFVTREAALKMYEMVIIPMIQKTLKKIEVEVAE